MRMTDKKYNQLVDMMRDEMNHAGNKNRLLNLRETQAYYTGYVQALRNSDAISFRQFVECLDIIAEYGDLHRGRV